MGCGGSKSAEAPSGGSKPAQTAAGSAGDAKPLPKKDSVRDGGLDHANLIVDNAGKLTDFYDIDKKKLGEGSYGSVCKGKNKSTKQVRAVKTIPKAQMKNIARFKQEIAIMKIMDHPNIIKLYETFEDHRNIYLCMELCSGGELFDRIIEAGHFNEKQAAILMQQIIRAIYYMHESSVCHRDLKPENFLFMNKDAIEKNFLKIIDFGLSCKFKPGQVLTTKAGTPYYVAPQVLAGKYDHLSDVWSCGVIMYVLLCGYPPFFGETDQDVLQKVKLGQFKFNQQDWRGVSEDAKILIRQLLTMDPSKRFSAEQALNHKWIRETAPLATSVSLEKGFVDNLRGFRSQNKLKKAALHHIAGQLNNDQIKALRETFMALDHNSDGQLTPAEMKEGIAKCLKEIPADLQQIMNDIDSDGSGVIDYTEFLAATLDRRLYMQEDLCWSAFRVFDRDGDGKITKDELKAVLGDDSVADAVGVDTIAKMMSDVDTNGDGEIDFKEFMEMMQSK